MIELVERRKPNEKHYLKDNGNVEIQIYKEKIHYLRNKKYEEITSRLIETDNNIDNIDNDYKTSFNKKNGAVRYEKDNLYLELIPKNIAQSAECIIEENTKKVSKILYKDKLNNVDLEYVISCTGIKENIILKNKINFQRVEYNVISNLDLEIILNTLIAKYDGEVIFKFNIPYMKDSNNYISNNVIYELGENTLSIVLDCEWLESNDRLYPITIDPSLENNSSGVDDTYIYQGDTNDVRYNRDYIIAGVEKINGQDRINRALLKFALPTLGTSDEIVRAQLYLSGYMAINELRMLTSEEAMENDDKLIEIHEVTADWNLQNASWNTMSNAYNQDVENVAYVSRSYLTDNIESSSTDLEPVITGIKNECLITNLVKKWYSGSPNYGIMLKQAEEIYYNRMTPMFFSSNFNDGMLSPVLVIEYRNQNGIEPYMDYITQNFKIGTAYLNTFNGNLTTIFNISHTIGVFPAEVGIAYNTQDVVLNNNTIYGKGYKLTYDQTIENVAISGVQKLKYTDGDGTVHYFHVEDDEYKDEDGLSLKISLTGTDCILKDKNGNKMFFEKNDETYYLKKVIDIGQKEVNIYRNSSNLTTKIKDYNNNEINILYETNKITFTSPSETAVLNYENGNLVNITTKEGITSLLYNENNLVIKITDVSGLSIKYDYYDGTTRKVKKITQFGLNNAEGKSSQFTYGLLNTKIVDNKGMCIVKVYNYYGNLLSTSNIGIDGNLKKAYSIANTYGNENINKNKVLSSTIPIRYSKNYFKLSYYNDILEHFLFSDDTNICTEEYEFDGNKSFAIKSTSENGYIKYKSAIGNEEKWTVSFLIKTLGKVKVRFYEWNTNETLYEKEFENNEIFNKIVYTSVGNQFGFEIVNEIQNKSTYIGDIQFEKGETANNYNLIDNPDFEDGTNGWLLTTAGLESDESSNIDDIFDVVSIDNYNNKALKINMHSYNMNHISKKIDVNGDSENLYYLSFWFKNSGLETGIDPISGYDRTGAIIGNSVSVYFEPLEGELEACIPAFELNSNKEVWQYYSMIFTPRTRFKSIRLEIHQARESGTLLLTNFALYKGLKTNKYEYDEYGNITKVKSTNETNIFNYSKDNELISGTDQRGRNFKIEYDNDVSDRVINAISSSGISNKVVYDVHGNPIKTKIIKNNSNEIEDGFYKIRQKGSNKYLNISNNNILLKEDYCNNSIFKVEKMQEEYKISDAVITNRCLVNSNSKAMLSKDTIQFFKLEQNENASYHIYINDDGNKKYLKWNNNNFEFVSNFEDINENYLYEFYFENYAKEFIEKEATYSSDGRFLTSYKDSLLNEVKYTTDATTGLITKKIISNDIETNYTYNDKNAITKILRGNKEVNYVYNSQNLLSETIQGNKTFYIMYDNFLNIKNIKINDYNLATNTYASQNGELLSTRYGNGNVINYQYDEYGRIKKIIKENNACEYLYNSNGKIDKVIETGKETRFLYDNENRIEEFKELYYDSSFHIKNIYNFDGDIAKQMITLNNLSHTIENSYNDDGDLLESNYDELNVKYLYDKLKRIKIKTIGNEFQVEYKYVSIGNRTSSLIESLTWNANKYSYKYDKLSNITDIYLNNNKLNHYDYDEYNELIVDEDYVNNIKTEYNYDNDGNILTKIKKNLYTNTILTTDLYEYQNSNWNDLLTKFNTDLITYDEIGNPLTIGDKTLCWENGKQLKSYISQDLIITYKYNSEGIRTEKNVNGIKTEYYLFGNNVIYEKTGNSVIYYLYDESGISGLSYNNVIYYFMKNVQGDVIGIFDSNYNIIAKYEYDSFGNILSIKDYNNQDIVDSSNVAIVNPYRYRGYYYDREIDMYYLNYRYYNPKWGRFINPDNAFTIIKSIMSPNLFIYCDNCPISKIDPEGKFPFERFWSTIETHSKGLAIIVKSLLQIKYTYSTDYTPTSYDTPLIDFEVGGSTTLYEKTLFGNSSAPFVISFDGNSDSSKNGGSIGINTPHASAKIKGSETGIGFYGGFKIKNKEYNAELGIDGLDAYYQIGVDYDDKFYKGSFYGKYSTNWVVPALGYFGLRFPMPSFPTSPVFGKTLGYFG